MEGSANVGAAIGMGATIDEAVTMAVAVADSIEAFDVTYDAAVFEKIDKDLDAYATMGFRFEMSYLLIAMAATLIGVAIGYGWRNCEHAVLRSDVWKVESDRTTIRS